MKIGAFRAHKSNGSVMRAISITALSALTIAMVAIGTSGAPAQYQCFYSCTARCAAKYACEQRNADLTVSPTTINAGPFAGESAVTKE
jgi:hypothetical protein